MKIQMSLYATILAVTAIVLACVLPVVVQGPTGPIGPTGDTGAIGNTGPQGTTGLQGIPGINGSEGEKGDKGDNGSIGLTGDPGVIRGTWVLVGTLTSLTSGTFDTNVGLSSPIKVMWTATAGSNDSCLIVKLQGEYSVETNIWRETNFLPFENKRGVEIALVNPMSEDVILTLIAKRGSFTSVTADIYRFSPPV